MPLARAALYGQGEDLHIAIWPGGIHNTLDITRFMAMEARSYVVSASGLMRKTDFPPETPNLEAILTESADMLANGGSCIAGPDGQWIVEPVVGKEKLIVATLDYQPILKERQNFDPAGHYARPRLLTKIGPLLIYTNFGRLFNSCDTIRSIDVFTYLPILSNQV
jgi:nitrilase